MKRLLLAACFALAGCGESSTVVRLYDGRRVEGDFVPAPAYAAYLEGALLEEMGDLRGALAAYGHARDIDDGDPAVWTRIGAVRCAIDLRSTAPDRAFAKALGADPTYAPALAAKAACAERRGDTGIAREAMTNAAHADPTSADIESLAIRLVPSDSRAGERAMALTLLHGDRPAAWDALLAWGRTHGNAEVVAHALEGIVRTAPMRSPEVEREVRALAARGETRRARRVAAVIADAPSSLGVRGPRDPIVARFAVDEALLDDDEAAATHRAARGHVSLAEVAARAALVERRDIAIHLAGVVLGADPHASAAEMVLAALGEDTLHSFAGATDEAPDANLMLFADRVAVVAGPLAARLWIARAGTVLVKDDELLAPLAVDLAARGVLPPTALGSDLSLELAARRHEMPPDRPGLDLRHAFLRAALTAPTAATTSALAANLAPAAEEDPIVGFAIARVAVANGNFDLARRVIATAPSDPLLLSVAVSLAKRSASRELARARTRLMAVAHTPAERALATD